MYLGFYGLEREPFHITPDPDFLYLSPSHKEAFATIVYGVEQRKGFVALTGEVGTGKTTVLRAYLKRIDNSKIHAIYLFNPVLSFQDLLRILLRELGVENPEEKHEPTMLEQIQWALLKEYESKRNVALIVDEAQNMPIETLEKMRMLSNLETTQDKLLQIVLVGQPELETTLACHELRQLRQRIAVQAHIRTLSPEESESYIGHRLMHAGCIRDKVFSNGALKAIVRFCDGTPRALNIACDNTLIAGYGGQEETISLKTAKEVLRDMARGRTRRPWNKAVVAGAAGMAAVLLLGLAFVSGGIMSASGIDETGEKVAAVAPAPASEPMATESIEESAAPADVPEKVELSDSEAAEDATTARTLVAATTPMDTRQIALQRMTEKTQQVEEKAAPKPIETEVVSEPEAAEALDTTTEASETEQEQADKPLVVAVAAKAEPVPAPEPAPAKVEEAAQVVAPEVLKENLEPEELPRAEEVVLDGPVTSAPVDSMSTSRVSVRLEPVEGDDAHVRKLVQEGDQLLRILVAVYGSHTPALIEEVLRLNPQIEDMNIIRAGDQLLLPAPERSSEAQGSERPDRDRNPS